MVIDGKPFMVICEDLNGTSNGRVPAGIRNRSCELYLLDMSIEDPAIEDLTRISVTPVGAEVTGAQATPDGKTLFVNSQHPSTANPFPYNNSLTYAITGWDIAVSAIEDIEEVVLDEKTALKVWPNPVAKELKFSRVLDAAIYNQSGQRIKVFRGQQSIDVSDLTPGFYFLNTSAGEVQRLIIK